MAPLESLGMVSYSHSIVTVALCCTVSEITRDIGLVENRDFFHTPCIRRPIRVGGGSPSQYCDTVWYKKNRIVWLSCGEKSLRICLAVSTEYLRLTDTLPRHSPRYA